MKLVIKNTFLEAADEESDADQPTVKRAKTESSGLQRLSSPQSGMDAEQEEEEGTSDAPHKARAVSAVVQHQPAEATVIAVDGARSPETEADEGLATSWAEQGPSQMKLVVKNTFFELIDEDEQKQPRLARAKTEFTALRFFKLGWPDEVEDETEGGLDHGIKRPIRAATKPTHLDDTGFDPRNAGPIRAATKPILVNEMPDCDPGMPREVEGFRKEQIEPVTGSVTSQAASHRTLMLRNLPLDYSRDMLLHLLDMKGFAGKYDFIYLPVDFKTQAGLGYAFLNMVSVTEAELVHTSLDGFNNWAVPSNKACAVAWSTPLQGLEAHIEQYRNSAVMHSTVPDNFKPAVFKDGVRVTFPRPTKRLKKPDQWKHARSIRTSRQLRLRGA